MLFFGSSQARKSNRSFKAIEDSQTHANNFLHTDEWPHISRIVPQFSTVDIRNGLIHMHKSISWILMVYAMAKGNQKLMLSVFNNWSPGAPRLRAESPEEPPDSGSLDYGGLVVLKSIRKTSKTNWNWLRSSSPGFWADFQQYGPKQFVEEFIHVHSVIWWFKETYKFSIWQYIIQPVGFVTFPPRFWT